MRVNDVLLRGYACDCSQLLVNDVLLCMWLCINVCDCSQLPVCVNGTDDLLLRGYEVSSSWLWYDQVGLLGLITVFLALTYFNLRTVKKLK